MDAINSEDAKVADVVFNVLGRYSEKDDKRLRLGYRGEIIPDADKMKVSKFLQMLIKRYDEELPSSEYQKIGSIEGLIPCDNDNEMTLKNKQVLLRHLFIRVAVYAYWHDFMTEALKGEPVTVDALTKYLRSFEKLPDDLEKTMHYIQTAMKCGCMYADELMGFIHPITYEIYRSIMDLFALDDFEDLPIGKVDDDGVPGVDMNDYAENDAKYMVDDKDYKEDNDMGDANVEPDVPRHMRPMYTQFIRELVSLVRALQDDPRAIKQPVTVSPEKVINVVLKTIDSSGGGEVDIHIHQGIMGMCGHDAPWWLVEIADHMTQFVRKLDTSASPEQTQAQTNLALVSISFEEM